jgi:dTDP-4-amino-4,6-dideoxygalactose transaminase
MTRFRVPLVDLAADWSEVGAAVEAAVQRVLRSGQFVLGPEVDAFEAEMATLAGTRFAVGVGSGTDALWLALRALGVGPGDEVVTSAFTYFATVEAILLCGARPVFVDIEEGGFNLDPLGVEAAIGPRCAAIVPVHLFGRCADMRAIAGSADARGLPVIEDVAQAIGASREGRRAGAWGRAAGFSFYPSKNLGGVGDGGCITTDDASLASRLRALRSHGSDAPGIHRWVGATSRLDAIQAAALRAKLPYLEGWCRGRARNAAIYARELEGCPDVVLPAVGPGETAVWSSYTIRCRRADAVRAALEAEGIEWRHYYPMLASEQPALGDARVGPGRLPRAERARGEVISVPVRGSCAPETIREIAAVIRQAAGG